MGRREKSNKKLYVLSHALRKIISSVHIISATHDDNNYDGYYIATQKYTGGYKV